MLNTHPTELPLSQYMVTTPAQAGAHFRHGSRPAPGWVPISPWVPACERVKKYEMRSFRGAGTAREPGTQAHGVLRYRQGAVFIGSGPAKRRPGMTGSQLRRFRHTGLRRDGLRFRHGSRPAASV